nr:mycothiol synthase [Gordonia soli]
MVTAEPTPDAASEAHRLVTAATAADGVAPLSEQSVLAIDGRHPGAVHVLATGAYANILPGREGEPAMIEAVVDPERRREGRGAALLRAAFGAAASLPGDSARAWAHGDLPGAQALAAALGLERRRELLQLRRPLGADAPLPDLAVGAGVTLRTYTGSADDAEILRVNNAAFAWHPEQGGWTQSEIDDRVGSDWFDPGGLFLVVDDADPQKVLGFHWTKVHDDHLGEVYIVGVDPAAQGRGLGRLLTLAGVRYLADRGLDEVNLYVEGDNTAALATYERLGFTRYAIDVAYG